MHQPVLVASVAAAPLLRIVPADISHVYALAATLRPDDRAEVEATGFDPRTALRRMYRRTHRVRTALVDGHVAAMWGCGGHAFADEGHPWLLTAQPIERVRFSYLREAARERDALLTRHRLLSGYVMASYTRSVKFLVLLGFTVDPAAPMGPNNIMHHKYWMKR